MPVKGVFSKLHRARDVLSDEKRKSLPRIAREVAAAGRRNGGFPYFYFSSMLYRNGAGELEDYLSNREVEAILRKLRRTGYSTFFKNKLLFNRHFRASGLPLVRLLGYSAGDTYVDEETGETRSIESVETLHALIAELVGRSRTGSVFVKPIEGSMGERCVRFEDPVPEAEVRAFFGGPFRNAHFVFEETIRQHRRLAELYPHSLNTLRVTTVRRPSGDVLDLVMIIRIGSGGQYVDNASAGGIAVGVDLSSGTVLRAPSTLHHFGGTVHESHPDTGVAVRGFQVPLFEEAVELGHRAARYIDYPLVGWDVAITDDGVVLLEGNDTPHLYYGDYLGGGYRNGEAMQALLKDLGVTRRPAMATGPRE